MAATAVVVVHGVIPHPPYDMQDQCAANLAKQLHEKTKADWVCDVWEPPNAAAKNTWTPLRSVTRVYDCRNHTVTAANVTGDYYDVIEAYWSPLDKGKTTAARLISWMLSAVFLPLNTAARYVASARKKRFDIAYVGAALILALAALVSSLWFAALSLATMAHAITTTAKPVAGVWDALGNLLGVTSIEGLSKLATGLTPVVIAWTAVGFAGAFLVFQAIKALLWLRGNWSSFKTGDDQRWLRFWADVALFGIGIALLFAAAILSGGDVHHQRAFAYFILCTGSFVFLRTLLQSFFVNFFGDVQIYTTQDQNSDFYALREAILTTVTGTIGQAMSQRNANGERSYDRVVILAHSLGSSIAMDALIRLYTLKEQAKALDPNDGLVEDFTSIRAFVTFGSSLEKTRYFFDVQRPSISQAALEFQNDQYGVLFTQDVTTLNYPNEPERGIYWTNLWYLEDPIANEITTYLSFLRPGDSVSGATKIRQAIQTENAAPSGQATVGDVICYNQQGWQKFALTASHIIVHGLYLGDDWFWQTNYARGNVDGNPHLGVLDVVTQKTTIARAPAPQPGFAPPQPPERPRFRHVPLAGVRDLRDKY